MHRSHLSFHIHYLVYIIILHSITPSESSPLLCLHPRTHITLLVEASFNPFVNYSQLEIINLQLGIMMAINITSSFKDAHANSS